MGMVWYVVRCGMVCGVSLYVISYGVAWRECILFDGLVDIQLEGKITVCDIWYVGGIA